MIILRFLPHPRILSTASFSVRSGVLLGMMLIPVLVWVPNHTQAQSTETQQVSLEQGENLVSLRVQPEDASLAAIFEGHLDQIHRVKDEKGRVYMPGDDIEQFTTWDADESYKVYATSAFDVEVSGTPLSLNATMVPLEKGGNLVPFLPADPQAVDDALASVSEVLVRVRDENKQIYEPSGVSSSLDSLRAGQGYVLYVDQPDTLVYTIRSATLADALNLEGVQIGQHVLVEGHDEPGDGGRGVFVVTNSGARMDGGTVFAFDEDLTQTTETITNVGNLENSSNRVGLSHSDLEWRGFRVRYGPDPEDVIGIKHLHGHNKFSGGIRDSYVDLEAGVIGHNAGNIERWWDEWGYNTKKVEITYKYTTSDRRLERKDVGNSVNIAWWGAPKADPNSPTTADNQLAWAANIASRIYQDNSYDWTYVDIPGEYYFRNYVEFVEGVKFRGAGALNADGFTRGTLKWMPGEILYHRKKNYSWQTDSDRERAYASNGRQSAVFRQEEGAAKIGAKKVKFDGNVFNNLDPFQNSSDYNDVPGWLQNSGSWSALYVVNFFPNQMPVELDDIHIKDMGGSGLPAANNVDGENAVYDVNTLLLDTSRRNHLFYGLSGAINDVTLKGHYWGGNPLSTGAGGQSGDATYTNVTVEDLESNPQYLMQGTFTDRRGGIHMENVTFDLKTSTLSTSGGHKLFNADDQGFSANSVTIETLKPENAEWNLSSHTLYSQRSRGQDYADQNPVEITSVNATDNGIPLKILDSKNFSTYQDVLIDGLTLTLAPGVTSWQNHPYNFVVDNKLANSMGKARRIEARNIDYQREFDGERGSLIHFSPTKGSGTYPIDFFGVDSEYAGGGWSKVVEYQIPDSARWADTCIFLENTTLNTGFGSDTHRNLNPSFNGGVVRMRNVTTNSGPSDESATYTATADDESNGYALIPTSLLSRARETDVTANAGYSVTGVEVANSDGTLRADDNTGQSDPHLKVSVDGSITQGDTFDWTARVTPTSMYSTKGLFVAREIANKSYTSGNGPFTLDLRGTATSQESGEKITYTASSGNTSVVSASVQADGYTLELTEQGTGTATITVTGEIEGVGSTTGTFEVKIQ